MCWIEIYEINLGVRVLEIDQDDTYSNSLYAHKPLNLKFLK